MAKSILFLILVTKFTCIVTGLTYHLPGIFLIPGFEFIELDSSELFLVPVQQSFNEAMRSLARLGGDDQTR